MFRTAACLFLVCCATGSLRLSWAARAAEPANSQAPFPLWDGHETIEQYARRADLPPAKTLDLGNGVNLELVLVPAGKFIMGTPEPTPVDEDGFRKKIVVGKAFFAVGVAVLLVFIATIIIRAIRKRHRPQYSLARLLAMTVVAGVAVLGGMHWLFSAKALSQAQTDYKAALARYQTSYDWEKPAHDVTLTKPFYMCQYEVTQEQYQQVMGVNPTHFKGVNLPVETVSWDDAMAFCQKVSQKTGLTVRLPTEAEWEFACRAGTTTRYNTGDRDSDLDKAAWYGANSKNTTHPVGAKAVNAWGLHDMHGNVWEWCQDCYEGYKPGAFVDPQGPSEGQHRLLRGGSWYNATWGCRSAQRNWDSAGCRFPHFGFRVVCGCVASRTP